jgi:hypothetical protein
MDSEHRGVAIAKSSVMSDLAGALQSSVLEVSSQAERIPRGNTCFRKIGSKREVIG